MIQALLSLSLVLAPASAWPVGEVLPDLATAADGEQRFALYLPTTYDPDQRWPVLLILDPRGRAIAAMRRFVPAAEALGYVLLSSYNTASDTDDAIARNQRAVDAMLLEAGQRLAYDPRRLYLAGFSGTSRAAWLFASLLEGKIAGVIGCGAGLPEPERGVGEVPFAYFATAGNLDFNYREMRGLVDELEKAGATYHFRSFPGPHAWMPEEVASHALGWLHLQAVRAGRAPRQPERLAAAYQAGLEAAERLTGDPLAVLRAYRALVRDYQGLVDVSLARRRAEELASRAEVRKGRAKEARLARLEAAYGTRIERWVGELQTGPFPPSLTRSLALLEVPKLQRQAAGQDPASADSAGRRLELAFVQTSSSLPHQFQAAGQMELAILSLQVALAIRPESRGSRWRLAEALVRAGRLDDAFEELHHLVDSGPFDPERLKTDPAWVPLHEDPRWAELLASVAASREADLAGRVGHHD